MKPIEFNKPTIFTGQSYDKKISVELDHSDLDINEVFDAFKSIALGLGFAEDSWNEYIIEEANVLEDSKRIDEWNKEDSEWQNDAEFNWDDIDSPEDWSGDEDEENPYPPNDELKEAAEEYKKETEDEGPEFDGAGFTEKDRDKE